MVKFKSLKNMYAKKKIQIDKYKFPPIVLHSIKLMCLVVALIP